jgi:hypothetical protein
MFHKFFLIFDELRLINPRIFLLAALLLTALNPLSAQVSGSGDVNPSPPTPTPTPTLSGMVCGRVFVGW